MSFIVLYFFTLCFLLCTLRPLQQKRPDLSSRSCTLPTLEHSGCGGGHTCLLSWLERPNSSNSFAPTTGKFGRNSLLRTIFKFLRLLSSTGRNTQWWPQHQPLVSREFCFSQILLNIHKIKCKILWEIEFCTKSLPPRLLFHGELEIPCKKFPALAMLRKIRQKICLRQDLNIMQLWRQ